MTTMKSRMRVNDRSTVWPLIVKVCVTRNLLNSAVTNDASVITKMTAPDMPSAVSMRLETPRNGQMPRMRESTTLFTRIAPTVSTRISLVSIACTCFYWES